VTHHGIEAAGVLPREGALMHRVFVWIRWRILAMLFAFAFVGYVQRTSVAIAAERMMPLLGLNQVQVGWLLTAFLVGYTIFQVPGALVGHWLGAGFESLAKLTDVPSKSLHRMRSPKGNPSRDNLAAIFGAVSNKISSNARSRRQRKVA
jgi:hypothetical protein